MSDTRDQWMVRLPAWDGQSVVVQSFENASDGKRFTGLKVLGPRGGIQGCAWFSSGFALDDVIGALQRARRDMRGGT
jgi:hypothetical protein